jgi:hypothetical protein
VLQPSVDAQLPNAPDDRYAGLQWRFVRIKYHFAQEGTRIPQDFYGEPWGIDAPAAEQNLSRRIKTATAIQVEDPILIHARRSPAVRVPLDLHRRAEQHADGRARGADPARIPAARRARHGRRLPRPARVGCLHARDEAAVPGSRDRRDPEGPSGVQQLLQARRLSAGGGLGSFLQGRTWERGGVVQHLRAILDDNGRPMVFINWNTDMGDGWEWSNAAEYPGYIKYTALAYRMGINEIIYALTH